MKKIDGLDETDNTTDRVLFAIISIEGQPLHQEPYLGLHESLLKKIPAGSKYIWIGDTHQRYNMAFASLFAQESDDQTSPPLDIEIYRKAAIEKGNCWIEDYTKNYPASGTEILRHSVYEKNHSFSTEFEQAIALYCKVENTSFREAVDTQVMSYLRRNIDKVKSKRSIKEHPGLKRCVEVFVDRWVRHHDNKKVTDYPNCLQLSLGYVFEELVSFRFAMMAVPYLNKIFHVYYPGKLNFVNAYFELLDEPKPRIKTRDMTTEVKLMAKETTKNSASCNHEKALTSFKTIIERLQKDLATIKVGNTQDKKERAIIKQDIADIQEKLTEIKAFGGSRYYQSSPRYYQSTPPYYPSTDQPSAEPAIQTNVRSVKKHPHKNAQSYSGCSGMSREDEYDSDGEFNSNSDSSPTARAIMPPEDSHNRYKRADFHDGNTHFRQDINDENEHSSEDDPLDSGLFPASVHLPASIPVPAEVISKPVTPHRFSRFFEKGSALAQDNLNKVVDAVSNINHENECSSEDDPPSIPVRTVIPQLGFIEKRQSVSEDRLKETVDPVSNADKFKIATLNLETKQSAASENINLSTEENIKKEKLELINVIDQVIRESTKKMQAIGESAYYRWLKGNNFTYNNYAKSIERLISTLDYCNSETTDNVDLIYNIHDFLTDKAVSVEKDNSCGYFLMEQLFELLCEKRLDSSDSVIKFKKFYNEGFPDEARTFFCCNIEVIYLTTTSSEVLNVY